uniref:protein ASPARTIC PROTEASE IN GUARD CELL 1-like n=1 Tax=Erigeron canadensis TaxID=72917 RepID=UPI001CB8E8E5|nr:protein ASPARTIC PROTEASE IN GUARD CELL 1-like [Erigeron canadensis]
MEKFLSSKASLFQTMLFFILISISLSFSSDTTTKSFDVVKSTQNALNALKPLSKEALQQQLLKKTLIISSYSFTIHPRTSVDHINVYHDYESLTLVRLQHDLHRVRAIGKNEYSGEYLVRVGFGTPLQDYMFVIMDTGSHLTWIQCEPCQKHCLEQIGDIFDPSASSSYKLLTCIFDDDCLPVREHKVCNWDRDVCEYEVVYVDGSFSNGDYVNETIHFHDSSSFPNLTMGCGQDQGPPFGYAGGVLGMSYHPLSFPFQIQADAF